MLKQKHLLLKGHSLDAAQRFIHRRKDSPQWSRFIGDLSTEQKQIVEAPITRSRWYEASDYITILEKVCSRLAPDDPEDFVVNLGGFVVDDGMNSIYRLFYKVVRPAFVVRLGAMFWSTIYKGSKLKVISSDKTHVHVAVLGAACCSIPLCGTISGGMMTALANAGARNVRLTHHQCKTEGRQDHCEYHFEWEY